MKANKSWSLRTKLFLSILLVGGFIQLSISTGFKFGFSFTDDQRSLLKKQVAFYLESVLAEIGNPASQEELEKVRQTLGFEVMVKEGARVVSTSELPSFSELSDRQFNRGQRWVQKASEIWPHPVGSTDRWWFTIVRRGEQQIAFFASKNLQRQVNEIALFAVLLVVTLVMVVFALLIRRWLKPLRKMREIAVSVGNGDYKVNAEFQGTDEIAGLGEAMKNMADKIHKSIENQQQLLRDVSHELRTPLTRMRLSLELMDESRQKGKMAADLTEMEQMIQQILNSFQLKESKEPLVMESFDLMPMIRELVTVFDEVKPGTLSLDAPDRQMVYGNPEKTQIVIKNLLDNGLKYSQSQNKEVQLGFVEGGFWVRDFGIGLADEEVDKVFEPFYNHCILDLSNK